jgi:hypothetical protein
VGWRQRRPRRSAVQCTGEANVGTARREIRESRRRATTTRPVRAASKATERSPLVEIEISKSHDCRNPVQPSAKHGIPKSGTVNRSWYHSANHSWNRSANHSANSGRSRKTDDKGASPLFYLLSNGGSTSAHHVKASAFTFSPDIPSDRLRRLRQLNGASPAHCGSFRAPKSTRTARRRTVSPESYVRPLDCLGWRAIRAEPRAISSRLGMAARASRRSRPPTPVKTRISATGPWAKGTHPPRARGRFWQDRAIKLGPASETRRRHRGRSEYE